MKKILLSLIAMALLSSCATGFEISFTFKTNPKKERWKSLNKKKYKVKIAENGTIYRVYPDKTIVYYNIWNKHNFGIIDKKNILRKSDMASLVPSALHYNFGTDVPGDDPPLSFPNNWWSSRENWLSELNAALQIILFRLIRKGTKDKSSADRTITEIKDAVRTHKGAGGTNGLIKLILFWMKKNDV
ncbi:MAG: hypothetical protein OEZ01_17305 [Candidatus Heimdallarchaeota archaeon]|nr:hypothetical protein [Candidatus Heimdallarchaeota archaeon]